MKRKKLLKDIDLRRTIIDKARIARLATADSEECKPHLVPVVFIFDGNNFYIPLDEKAKRSKPENLKRVKNIHANPNVALLIDEYNEDWKKIWFIMIQGNASLINNIEYKQNRLIQRIHRLLYEKYPQYLDIGIGEFCIMIQPQKVISWKNG
jgi:PPOX class probable F420-dependent enzyme